MDNYPFKECAVVASGKHQFITLSKIRVQHTDKDRISIPMVCQYCLHIQWTEFI